MTQHGDFLPALAEVVRRGVLPTWDTHQGFAHFLMFLLFQPTEVVEFFMQEGSYAEWMSIFAPDGYFYGYRCLALTGALDFDEIFAEEERNSRSVHGGAISHSLNAAKAVSGFCRGALAYEGQSEEAVQLLFVRKIPVECATFGGDGESHFLNEAEIRLKGRHCLDFLEEIFISAVHPPPDTVKATQRERVLFALDRFCLVDAHDFLPNIFYEKAFDWDTLIALPQNVAYKDMPCIEISSAADLARAFEEDKKYAVRAASRYDWYKVKSSL